MKAFSNLTSPLNSFFWWLVGSSTLYNSFLRSFKCQKELKWRSSLKILGSVPGKSRNKLCDVLFSLNSNLSSIETIMTLWSVKISIPTRFNKCNLICLLRPLYLCRNFQPKCNKLSIYESFLVLDAKSNLIGIHAKNQSFWR